MRQQTSQGMYAWTMCTRLAAPKTILCYSYLLVSYLLCTFSCLDNTDLVTPSITQGATITKMTSVSVSWSQVLNATGYYVSYQRQDLGTPAVVTPQYERIVGGATTSVTLSDLQPGTTYRIRVWSTNGASVSSGTGEMNVATMETGESFCTPAYFHSVTVLHPPLFPQPPSHHAC